MKNILSLILLGIIVSFYSCGNKKYDKKPENITIQKEAKKEVTKTIEAIKGDPVLIAKGQKLFKDKTCFTCHQPDTKIIGPSIKDINKIYTQKGADIIAFLKSNSDPIVDLDPGQVAIMKANLDSFVKDLKEDELISIKAYMQSVN